MKTLRIITATTLLSCLIYSCSTSKNTSTEGKRKRSKITTITPGLKNPTKSVINASGDGLTPGIGLPATPGSKENATNIASNAIGRANNLVKGKSQNLEMLTDEELINRMATAQQMEITASNRVSRTTSKDKIKSYASMVSANHTEIQKELKKLSSQKNMVLENQVLLGGNPKTDRDFVKMMLESNQNLVALYTIGSNSKDPELKLFTLKQLPLLRKHLEIAQELSQEIK